MFRLVPIVALIALGSVAWQAVPPQRGDASGVAGKKADQQPQKKQELEPALRKFMLQKLEASNDVLAGLMTDDFDRIANAADKLSRMSQAEEWRVSNDPTYARFGREYRQAIERLKSKTRKSAPEQTAVAWMNVTLSCIECHQWVRNTIIADDSK